MRLKLNSITHIPGKHHISLIIIREGAVSCFTSNVTFIADAFLKGKKKRVRFLNRVLRARWPYKTKWLSRAPFLSSGWLCAGSKVQSWPWPSRCSRQVSVARKCRSVRSNPVEPCTRSSSIDELRSSIVYAKWHTHPLMSFCLLWSTTRISDVKWNRL